ncbi:MAG: dioxygenase [Paenibacillus sp.]|jgi:protocatechuate 3,4-dioxygenase beta subunit|nr:dioxygenase [Paenibacillus sp.]
MRESDSKKDRNGKIMTRRQFLFTGLMLTATAALAACGINLGDKALPDSSDNQTAKPSTAPPQASVLEPTPACVDKGEATPAVTEGPYFTPNSPERTSLVEKGIAGTVLTLTGYVMSTDCKPVKHALLDFWQADSNGEYDNKGFTLRGHQYTDDNGKYTLETVVPGLYHGRTRHIHVKVQAPNQSILTTQLFFPNESGNAKDGIYKDALLMSVQGNSGSAKTASYNFVLHVG